MQNQERDKSLKYLLDKDKVQLLKNKSLMVSSKDFGLYFKTAILLYLGWVVLKRSVKTCQVKNHIEISDYGSHRIHLLFSQSQFYKMVSR